MAPEAPHELVAFARGLGYEIGDAHTTPSKLLTRLLAFADGFVDVP